MTATQISTFVSASGGSVSSCGVCYGGYLISDDQRVLSKVGASWLLAGGTCWRSVANKSARSESI